MTDAGTNNRPTASGHAPLSSMYTRAFVYALDIAPGRSAVSACRCVSGSTRDHSWYPGTSRNGLGRHVAARVIASDGGVRLTAETVAALESSAQPIGLTTLRGIPGSGTSTSSAISRFTCSSPNTWSAGSSKPLPRLMFDLQSGPTIIHGCTTEIRW